MPPKTETAGRNAYAGFASHGTPVAAQQIWSEHVQKELRYQVPRTEYTRNPCTVSLLPEKPTDRRRELALRSDASAEREREEALERLRQTDPKAHQEVVERIHRSQAEPRKKYPFAQTTAQEIGWDLDDTAAAHAEEARPHAKPLASSDVSQFAAEYVLTHHHHPFSTQQFKYQAKKK